MNDNLYGLWPVVILNSVLVIVFAASFFHPQSKRDWRTLGGFSAFIIALFTEMYGYPLTVYLLSGPLSGLIPGVNLSHNSGHLWNDLIGWKGDAHISPFHLASYLAIGGGFWLVAAGWKHLYQAQKTRRLATSGPYARIRHPQYSGLTLIMIGFLLQWPTLATLLMFPILLAFYRHLAIREERDVAASFGPAWLAYAADTPRFLPRRRGPQPPVAVRRSAAAREPAGRTRNRQTSNGVPRKASATATRLPTRARR